MGRALRTNIENGWHHVMGRGLDRRGLFADDRDRDHFVELLGEVHQRYRFAIHAWVLMDTHYHALLQTPDANLYGPWPVEVNARQRASEVCVLVQHFQTWSVLSRS